MWDDMMKYKTTYENAANDNEAYVLDILNNFDKIIFRGQAKEEIDLYKKSSDDCIEKAKEFYHNLNIHTSFLNLCIYTIILGSLYYIVKLRKTNEIDTKVFITIFTIFIMYRDKLSTLLSSIPTYLEFNGRIDYAKEKMSDLIGDYNDIITKSYETTALPFNTIEFKHLYYKYKNTNSYLFEDLNISIEAKHNIVGITGLSGRGKSTLMKLLLKMYPCENGEIRIDGKNIRSIDPLYIRKRITYVNQSSKLFNKKIIENIMYGCESEAKCKEYLNIIMSYPKIRNLYKHVDLVNGTSGSLGEGLSGGQRQIVNIISGLINPSPILVLDEPTNALDVELKSEILNIIDKFKMYKKCIIIITHDRDVYPIFDQIIKL